MEDADSTKVESTQLIHDSNNGTNFSHSTLTTKITNFMMKNSMAQYGGNQNKTDIFGQKSQITYLIIGVTKSLLMIFFFFFDREPSGPFGEVKKNIYISEIK